MSNASKSGEKALTFLEGLKADLKKGVYQVFGWAKIETIEARQAAVDEFLNAHCHKSAASSDGIPTFVLDTTLSDRREYLMVQKRLANLLNLDVGSIRLQSSRQEDGLMASRENRQSAAAVTYTEI
jgi:hypothetical protein